MESNKHCMPMLTDRVSGAFISWNAIENSSLASPNPARVIDTLNKMTRYTEDICHNSAMYFFIYRC